MGIADVREAFQRGAGGTVNCAQVTLDYLDGGARQRLTFTLAGGEEIIEEVSAEADLNAVAEAAGRRRREA
jgi:hypothetical protein